MYELPLFPLNTVLFPGTPIHLHIFEPRYVQMINLCVDQRQPFGVVLIREGMEALGPLAEPHHIGCTAQIAQIKQLEGGRMDLVALGQERFRLLDVDRETHPYLLGRVQSYPIENPDPSGAEYRSHLLHRQFDRFVQLLLKTGNNQPELDQLPEDGAMFGYLAAAVLQISPLQKQELLAAERLDKLLERLTQHYRRELALLEAVLSDHDSLQAGGFSIN
jgi:Lon protease-like protein